MLIPNGKPKLVDDWRGSVGARVVLPALVFVAIGLIALYLVSQNVARDLDNQALVREQNVVETLIMTKADHMGKMSIDYGFWTAAYDHLADKVDPEWMDGNFDQDAANNQGANAFLLVREDMAIEAWFGDPRDDAAIQKSIGLRSLFDRVLSQAKIGSHEAHGLISWQGQPAMVGVTRLTRQDSSTTPGLPRKLVVFIQKLKPELVTQWSNDLKIENMRLATGTVISSAAFPLIAADGTELGAITWTSDRPGSRFMMAQAWMRLAIMVILVGAFIALVFGWAAVMRDLHRTAGRASAEAESSHSKSAFLANMSHELRTPLNAIIGFSEMMRDEVFGTLGQPQYKEYVGHVHNSGKHLLSIINSLLDVAKFQAGQYEQNLLPISVHELVKSAEASHARTITDSGLTFGISGDGTALVLADSRSMARIIDAVIGNATKFTPRGGRIEIEMQAAANTQAPAIIIRDTGIGIAPNKLEALGRPFEQAAEVLKREHGGVGLGLAFAKLLAAGMNGTLTLQSRIDEGTSVTLTLQPAPAEAVKAAA